MELYGGAHVIPLNMLNILGATDDLDHAPGCYGQPARVRREAHACAPRNSRVNTTGFPGHCMHCDIIDANGILCFRTRTCTRRTSIHRDIKPDNYLSENNPKHPQLLYETMLLFLTFCNRKCCLTTALMLAALMIIRAEFRPLSRNAQFRALTRHQLTDPPLSTQLRKRQQRGCQAEFRAPPSHQRLDLPRPLADLGVGNDVTNPSSTPF